MKLLNWYLNKLGAVYPFVGKWQENGLLVYSFDFFYFFSQQSFAEKVYFNRFDRKIKKYKQEFLQEYYLINDVVDYETWLCLIAEEKFSLNEVELVKKDIGKEFLVYMDMKRII